MTSRTALLQGGLQVLSGLLVVSAISILIGTIRRRVEGSKRDPGARKAGRSPLDPRILGPTAGVVLLVLAGVMWPFVVDGAAGSQDAASPSLDRVVAMWFVVPLFFTSTVTVIALAVPNDPLTAYRLLKDFLSFADTRHGPGSDIRRSDDQRD